MKLILRESTPQDFEAAKEYYKPETGELSAAAAKAFWNPSDSSLESAKRRVEWSCNQQKDVLLKDPTARMLTVVDADDNDAIVAFGRWHYYPNGPEQHGDLEFVGDKSRKQEGAYPEGMMATFYDESLGDLLRARPSWMGSGPCWVLTNVVTREPLRTNGAGSLIIQWGLKRAKEDKLPAFLESEGAANTRLYGSHGFNVVEPVAIDCAKYGLPGVIIEISRMRADSM